MQYNTQYGEFMKVPFFNAYKDKKRIISEVAGDAISYHVLLVFLLPAFLTLYLFNDSQVSSSPTNFLYTIIIIMIGVLLIIRIKAKLDYKEDAYFEKGKVYLTSFRTTFLAIILMVCLLFTIETVSKPVPIKSLYGFTVAEKFDENDLEVLSDQGVTWEADEEGVEIWDYMLNDPSKPELKTYLYLNHENLIVRISVKTSTYITSRESLPESAVFYKKKLVDALNEKYGSLAFISVNNYFNRYNVDDTYKKVFSEEPKSPTIFDVKNIFDTAYQFWGDGRNQLWLQTGGDGAYYVSIVVLQDNLLMKEWSKNKIVSREERKLIDDKVGRITALSWE